MIFILFNSLTKNDFDFCEVPNYTLKCLSEMICLSVCPSRGGKRSKKVHSFFYNFSIPPEFYTQQSPLITLTRMYHFNYDLLAFKRNISSK